MPMKIAVIGSNGQLGQDIVRDFSSNNHKVVPLTHADIEVSNFANVTQVLTSIKPDVVVNTAAYHNVVLCEENPDIAHRINVLGSKNVSEACLSVGAKVVFISTDYVFKGEIGFGEAYLPQDVAEPINVYGETKRKGELAVLEHSGNNLIYRISSVFGQAGSSGKGGNFIEAILKKVSAGQVAQVVNDTRMSPTYTLSSAGILRGLLEQDAQGVEHGSSIGQCSWFELAQEAARLVNLAHLVKPIESPSDTYPKRPRNSALATAQLESFGIENEHWAESVSKYMLEKGYIN